MSSLIEQFSPKSRVNDIAMKVSRVAGQIRSPSVSHRVMGLTAQLWVLVLGSTLFFIHPVGWLVLGLNLSFLYAVWFSQSSWSLRDVNAGLANVWTDTREQAPSDLVARIRNELVNAPSLLTEEPDPSRFMLLEEPTLTPDQVWLVVGWNRSWQPDDLEDDVVIADSIEQIQELTKEAKRPPLIVISETELAVAQFRFNNFWHWDASTRGTVQKWLAKLNKVRTGDGSRAFSDQRHFDNKNERDQLIRIEGIGLPLYRDAHPVNVSGVSPLTREQWITEVRQLGQQKHDRDMAWFRKKMAGTKWGDGPMTEEHKSELALAVVNAMETETDATSNPECSDGSHS